jgi:hypothetical protein
MDSYDEVRISVPETSEIPLEEAPLTGSTQKE